MMMTSFILFHKRFMAIATVATLGMGIMLPVGAQVANDADPLEDFQTQDNGNDILDGNTQQGIQDLIHQINLSGGLSMEDFNAQGQENILSEADRFRQLQRVRIDQEQNAFENTSTETTADGVEQ